MLTQELPKEKIEDYNNILNLLSFHLKIRDIDHITNFVIEFTKIIGSMHIPQRTKSIINNELFRLSEKGRYTFQVPEIDKNALEEILGSTGDKSSPEDLKH